MAGSAGSTNDALEYFAALHAEPYRYDFRQALRRLECLFPERPRIGQSLHAQEDPVRLAQRPSLAFAPSTLASFDTDNSGLPPRMEVFFLGIFGPNGPLPLHLTEYARDRLRNENDPTVTRFADVFHHRILSLFYRAWAATEPTVSFDRPESDRFGDYVASLIGIGMPALRNRDAMPDLAKLHYAGLFVNQPRSAESLQGLLNDYFKMPVEIEQFVGQWLDLPGDCRCHLGKNKQCAALGNTTTVGARIWECRQKFRVVVGPLTLDQFRRLLPKGTSLTRMVAVIKNFVGSEMQWDVRLILKNVEIPRLQLGVQGQLGWTTWIASRPFARDADDLCVAPRSEAA